MELEKPTLSETPQIQKDKCMYQITSLQSATPEMLEPSSGNRWKQVQRFTANHWPSSPSTVEDRERS